MRNIIRCKMHDLRVFVYYDITIPMLKDTLRHAGSTVSSQLNASAVPSRLLQSFQFCVDLKDLGFKGAPPLLRH